jgi:hypothetical protein
VVGLADQTEELHTGRSPVPPAVEQVEQVAEDSIVDFLLSGIARAQHGVQSDPGIDDEYGHHGRNEDKNPDDLGTDLRQQAEEFC